MFSRPARPARQARVVALVSLVLAATAIRFPGIPTFQHLGAQALDRPKYLLPSPQIVATFDHPPLPDVTLSPSRQLLALTMRKGSPSLSDLARTTLRLAGSRVDPKNNGPHRTAGIYAITLRTIADNSEIHVTVPPQANLTNIRFSPDGSRLAFANIKDAGIDLWVADTTSGRARMVSGTDRLNAATGDPCDWLGDNVTLVCQLVPSGRGPAPVVPVVPEGPPTLENRDQAAPAETYEDMIRTPHDEVVFEYYFTSQLAAIDTATGRESRIGRPAVFDEVLPSPNDAYLLASMVKRPYSHLIPMDGFPKDVEIWTRRGEVAHRIADLPSREGTPLTGVRVGPREYRWRPDQPATVVWIEALDGGNQRNQVPFRDRVMTLAGPFTGAPVELAKTAQRFSSLSFTDKGMALLTESDRATRRVRTWILGPDAPPRKLWDRKQDDRYADAGTPLTRADGSPTAGGQGGRGGPRHEMRPIVQNGDHIYLAGQGAGPEGDRPFLDRLNLKTLAKERLFRSENPSYEAVIAPLTDDVSTILTRSESLTETPNYFTRTIADGARRAVTTFHDPQERFRGVERQFITYPRKDGVKLSATLYLPPGYQKGERLPLVMWAYPREFGDTDTASQVVGAPNRFTLVTPGNTHMYLLFAGYAILDGPTMPIVGPGETANDHYIEQLVASAEAAIDKVVEMGVADRNRVGVGGHSYGAFMTANLLAHSRLFRAGFAESGAYNRTLTPFGFQSERRTFWEVPDLYGKMSPFFYAHQIKDPILLTHGEMDDNNGTFPIQSERFYMALKGHGATVRYITLPYEAHGYAARETHLHLVAEKIAWFDRYVKNAIARATTDSPR
jgi:dipeptidyl aminopeptidase/acylaminoacyl peptidase